MTLLNLKDNIKTILGGTPEETAGFRRSFFHLADTPQLLKDLGLIGDYFSIRYGVITRHKGKDVDHALTAQNWIDLCDEIIRPFAIVRFETGYRMLVNVKVDGNFAAVGVEVKNTGKSFDINAITSVYGRKGSVKDAAFVYVAKNLTPEQLALLDGHNFRQYLAAHGGGGGVSSLPIASAQAPTDTLVSSIP